MTGRYKAVQLFSGGLDSILSARIISDEGFEITALHFYTGFNDLVARSVKRGPGKNWAPEQGVIDAAQELGIKTGTDRYQRGISRYNYQSPLRLWFCGESLY